jgi:hypothetical protein
VTNEEEELCGEFIYIGLNVDHNRSRKGEIKLGAHIEKFRGENLSTFRDRKQGMDIQVTVCKWKQLPETVFGEKGRDAYRSEYQAFKKEQAQLKELAEQKRKEKQEEWAKLTQNARWEMDQYEPTAEVPLTEAEATAAAAAEKSTNDEENAAAAAAATAGSAASKAMVELNNLYGVGSGSGTAMNTTGSSSSSGNGNGKGNGETKPSQSTTEGTTNDTALLGKIDTNQDDSQVPEAIVARPVQQQNRIKRKKKGKGRPNKKKRKVDVDLFE